MKFSANISILFRDCPFLQRFEHAARAGFGAVELWWPSGESLADVEAAVRDSGVEVVLLNFDAGDMPAGDRGLLSDPDRQRAFRENVPVALSLAERLGCRQLNALVGLALPDVDRRAQLDLAAENLAWAAREAAAIDARVLIEALNTFDNGPYLVTRTDEALDLIERAGEENLALQYDAYHMQRMEGNLAATIRCHAERIAHVQIADSPGRGEPGTGEINFPYLFGVLETVGYRGYIGLEYLPTTKTTEESFRWMSEWIETAPQPNAVTAA
jgi:hydroxypyruvate isomerase